MADKPKPAAEIRLGRIRAVTWENHSDSSGTWYSVSVSRLYKEGERWQDSTSFRRDDLPIVAKVVDMAYTWIWDQDVPVHPESPIPTRSANKADASAANGKSSRRVEQ